MMHRTALWVALLLAGGAAWAQAPEISYCNEGTRGGETLILTGDGFVPGRTEVRVYTPEAEILAAVPLWSPKMKPEVLAALRPRMGTPGEEPALPAAPPPDAARAEILTISDRALACVMPEPILLNTRVVWVGVDGRWSAPYLMNRAELWWTLPEFPAPGSMLEVFGRGPAHDWMGQAGIWILSERKEAAPTAQFNVVEGNKLWECPRAIHFGPQTANNVARRNTFTDCAEGLLDEGQQNRRENPAP